MYKNGLAIARLNFSHGTHVDHLKSIALIRSLNKQFKNKLEIMQDLEGYRMRLGRLLKPIELIKGTQLYLTNKDIIGDSKEVSFDYKGPLARLRQNTLIYIDDGKIMLRVKKVEKYQLKTVVLAGGVLKERKGLNIPQLHIQFTGLTDKDKEDVEIAIGQKLDYVAQSFVSTAKDLQLLKDIIKKRHPRCKIFAKIENRKAVTNIDEIIAEADGVMIARGDLGISVPIYQVPIIQKEIITKCRLKRKPVVVATQMLESMTEELIPTRAEVSDVANAIFDGATHLMLSAETATGKYPDEVVKMMQKIITYTQAYRNKQRGG